ncbi:hypothetical protein JYB64_21610, partial [Algoriphagus aestuarii]|nr:hypothetical protein [Algoriphagus aestuarii]
PHAEFHGDLVGFPWQVLDLFGDGLGNLPNLPENLVKLLSHPLGSGKGHIDGAGALARRFDEDFCFVVNGQGDELVHLRSPPLPIWESDSSWGIFRVCSASMMT